MKMSICGPSYTSQSPNADDQLCMNRYPEVIESGEGAARIVLYPTPGTKTFITLSDRPVRAQCRSNSRSFAIGGSIFCEVFADGTKTDYSPIVNDGLPASMAVGNTQILIASGGTVYVFDLLANTLTPIPPATLTNVAQVAYCDGFFLALLKNSDTFQASDLNDATTWNPLSESQVGVFPDDILSMLVDHREVWLFGVTRSVVYYDSGASPFPFDVVPGGTIEQGIVAANSPVRLDNSIFWLGGDERGSGIAWRAQGYTPQRVSNHATEFAWQNYSRIDDAVGYSYQDQGHSFWVLYFPTANKTWVYDVATNMWHERGYWNVTNGLFTAHRSQNHVFSFGKHLVGDWASGNIYEMNINFYSDDSNPLRWVRRAAHITSDRQWQFHSQVQIYLEAGVGPIPPLTGPSEDPQSIYLADSLANIWTLAINDAGLLTTTAGGTGPAQTFFLNDNQITQSWEITVDTGGLLHTTAVTYNASYPESFAMATTPGQLESAILVGNGLLETDEAVALARDPMLNIRWSDDGGHKWSNEYSVGIGQAGKYRKRAIFRRLGRTRDRVYEISGSDPVPYRIIDAELN